MKHNNTRVALTFAMRLSALHSFPLIALLSFAATPAFASWTADESAKTISDGTFTINFNWKNQSSTPREIVLKSITTYPASPAVLDLRTVEGEAGLRVVGIEDGWGNKNIGELWFADTISSLQYFNCASPTNSLIIPSALTSIDVYFKNANYTGDLVIPPKITSIGSYAFENGKYTSIDLSQATGLVTLGQQPFKNCNAITNAIVIPPNVEELGAQALCFNIALVDDVPVTPLRGDLKLPGSLKKIGSFALSNGYYTSIDFSEATNLVEIGANAFAWSPSYQIGQKVGEVPCTDLDLSACVSLTNVGDSVFKRFGQVRSLVFPDSVQRIGTTIFYEKDNMLTNLVLSASLDTLSSYPFCKWASKSKRGVTHMYFRNCPATIGGSLFDSVDPDSVICYLPKNRGYREAWKAFVAANPDSGLTLPPDDNSSQGTWKSGGGSATQCAKVVWYTAKYPSPDGFYIIVR